MPHLYHGSVVQDLKTLEPRKRYSAAGKIDFAAIYATPSPAFAAAHSFPWSSDEGVGLSIDDGKISLSVPKQLKERLQAPISIYTLPADSFELTTVEETGYTWHTIKTVTVLEEKQYENVEAALKELGAEVEYI